MANDLQGVWRFVSQTLRGGQVHTQQTHLVVNGSNWREVWNRQQYADQPRSETQFQAEEDLLHVATTWHQPDGSAHGPFTATWRFHLDGDKLQICNAGNDIVPPEVSDEEGVVSTFERVTDREQAARISEPQIVLEKPVRTHETLGELHWDDNLGWWKTADGLIGLAVKPDADLDAHAARAQQIQERIPEFKTFAAEQLLAEHNTTWREGPGRETKKGFIGKLKLDGITLGDDLSAELYFADGGLFWGHIVLISVDADGKPTGAIIAG